MATLEEQMDAEAAKAANEPAADVDAVDLEAQMDAEAAASAGMDAEATAAPVDLDAMMDAEASPDVPVDWEGPGAQQLGGKTIQDYSNSSSNALYQGLDYVANALRTGLYQGAKSKQRGEGYVDQAGEIALGAWSGLTKEKMVDVPTLVEEMNRTPTLLPIYGKLSKKDGEAEWADVPEVIRDFAIGVATDPLSLLLTKPLKYIGKNISNTSRATGRGLDKLANSQRAVKTITNGEEVTENIARFSPKQRAALEAAGGTLNRVNKKVGTAGAVGGLVGGSVADKDADLIDNLQNIALGTVIGSAVPLVAKPVGAVIKAGADGAANAIASKIKGPEFAEISSAKELGIQSSKKIKGVVSDIMQKWHKSMTGTTPETRFEAREAMSRLKTELISRREMKLAKDLEAGLVPEFGHERARYWNQMSDDIANDMEMDGTVASVIKGKAEETTRIFQGMLEDNKWVTEKVNREVYGIPSGQWDKRTGKGVAGIRYHVEDIHELKTLEQTEAAMKAMKAAKDGPVGPLKAARSLERSKAGEVLSDKEMREKYAIGLAQNWLDKTERDARALMAKYREAPGVGSLGKTAVLAGQGFDKLNHVMKFSMLFQNTTWLKNTYPDNVTRAYQTNGLIGALDAATFSLFKPKRLKDIIAITSGESDRVFQSKNAKDYVRLGVLDNNQYKDALDIADEALKYSVRPETVEKMRLEKLRQESTNPAVRGAARVAGWAVAPFKFVGNKIVSPIGQFMESTSRAVTYDRALDDILSNKTMMAELGSVEAAKKKAAKIVNDVFFDYADVTEAERMLMKRMYPFWTYYKNNAIYYAKAMQDPSMLSKINATQRLRHSVGEPLSEEERQTIPEFIQGGDPRFLGTDDTGRRRYYHSPSDPMLDAARIASFDLNNILLQKMSPLVKTVPEFYFDKDTFTGAPMLPSTSPKNEKHLFSGGSAHYELNEFLNRNMAPSATRDAVARGLGVFGTEMDKNGNPIATDDASVMFDKMAPWGINSMFWPKPAVTSGFGVYHKLQNKTASPSDVMNNLLNTNQITGVSEGQTEWQRNKSEELKAKLEEYKQRKAAREHGIKATE